MGFIAKVIHRST